jgi:hypothetical protein
MVGRVALKLFGLTSRHLLSPVTCAALSWRVGVFNLCPYKRESHTSLSSAQTTAAGGYAV